MSSLQNDIAHLSKTLFSASTFLSGGENLQIEKCFNFLQAHSLPSVLSFLRSSCESHDEACISSTTLVLDGIFSSREVMAEVAANEEASEELVQALCEATQAPHREVRLLAISLFKHLIRFDIFSGRLSLRSLCSVQNDDVDEEQMRGGEEEEEEGKLLDALISRMADEDVGVAESVEHAIFLLAEKARKAGVSDDALLSTICKTLMRFAESSTAQDDVTGTIKVRICTFVSKVCGKLGEDGFLSCVSSGLVTYFLNLFAASSDDLLLQMSLLELIPRLASTRRGFAVLENTIIHLLRLAGLSSIIHGDGDEIDGELEKDSFLGDAAYATLCDIMAASRHSSLVAPVVKGCVDRLEEGGVGEEQIVNTLGSLSNALERDWTSVKENKETLLRLWGKRGTSRSEIERVACFSSLAKVIRGSLSPQLLLVLQGNIGGGGGGSASSDSSYKELEEGGKDIEAACETILRTLKDSSAPRARCAAYDLLAAVVETGGERGIKAVFTAHKELASVLLVLEGNDVERDSKEGREWRFSVFLGALKHESQCRTILSQDLFTRLQNAKDAGPHLPPRSNKSEAAVMGPILRGSE